MKTPPPKKRGRPKDKELTARRREQILDVAAGVFAGHGYRGADVQLVADQAGVGKGTVYRYFPSKRDLFLATVDHGMRRLKLTIDAATGDTDDELERMTGAVRAYLAFFDANPDIVELFIQERAEFKDRKKPAYFESHDANVGPWKKNLRMLVSQGRVRDIPVRRITDVVGDLLYGTMFTNHIAGRRRSFKQQAREILDVVFLGILSSSERTNRGLKRDGK